MNVQGRVHILRVVAKGDGTRGRFSRRPPVFKIIKT